MLDNSLSLPYNRTIVNKEIQMTKIEEKLVAELREIKQIKQYDAVIAAIKDTYVYDQDTWPTKSRIV